MQNNNDESELEEKLLNNSLLFSSIRKNKTTEVKIEKIKKYLDRGADVNATDANYKNNTPLHVAVMKKEPKVVSLLLERGALLNNRNSDNQTALDIARLSDKSTCKDIVTILEAFNSNKFTHASSQQEIDTTTSKYVKSTKIIQDPKDQKQSQSQVVHGTSGKNTKIVQNKPKQQKCSKESKKSKVSEVFKYLKRTGTSGLSGQLYETKLLTMILFRALYVQEVKTFLLATNVDNMGAFDDIVFRFSSNKGDKPKMMFVQAKHRDHPERDRFTVEEIMKFNGDFSLHKYIESYIKISQMFVPENSDDMFRGEFKNMDCEFIIYTSAHENFTKMKAVEHTHGKRFINSSEGKIFQFDYDEQDVEVILDTVAKSRAVVLAKQLSKFIFKDNNYINMMLDDFIKTYHVYLSQNILEVELSESPNNFHYAKFRKSLFSSNDNLLLAFKSTICKEVLLQKKNISPEKLDEVENVLMSLTFKVPTNFGNLNFCFDGSEQQKEKKLVYLCSKFKQLFERAKTSVNIVMKLDDNMVGPSEIFKSTDLEPYKLGGLVGNLLVFDDETKSLKFNFDVDTLSDDNLKLLTRLKSDVFVGIDLSECRFDINVHRFPRLSLVYDKYDKNLIKEFLSKLIFYTNQATEDKLESVLKEEIDKYFITKVSRQSDTLFRVKSDAIYIKVHDCVQNWWKQPINAQYLTDSCKYFLKAEQDFLSSPLLSILHFTYTKTLKKASPELIFKDTALELLQLEGFFKGSAKKLSIITEENALSCLKLLQYFKERNFNDYTVIDMDFIVNEKYFVDVKLEIKESKISTIIIVCQSDDFVAEISLLIKHFKGKVITISHRDLANQINENGTEDAVEIVDDRIGFQDFADKMCKMLLEERYIVFQGKKILLGKLFEEKTYYLINSHLLYKIINNEIISIGNYLNNPIYDEISDVYLNEEVYRYIRLDLNDQTIDELNVLKYTDLEKDFTPDTRDIVLITDKQEEFADFINSYDCNVHWFSSSFDRLRREEYLVWQKSRGNLLKILKHIQRGVYDEYVFEPEELRNICEKIVIIEPKILKDVSDKVVIISAEPGMGKSCLLTHLAINTKHTFPELWISKINLLEITKELRRLKDNQVIIDLKEAVQFLLRVINFEAARKKNTGFEILIEKVSVIGDLIRFNNSEVELNFTGLDLFEIELFIHCYNNDRVVVLFDGFDEICPDFANEFIQLVNILKKSKVVHLWITSRLYNVLHQLENALETFSFTIRPLSYHKKVNFLRKLLTRKFGSNKLDNYPVEDQFRDCVVKFYYMLTEAVLLRNPNFLSIPLYLYILTEIFQEHFFNDSFNPYVVNLSIIYELFVDVKFFKIRFGDKKPLLCINDPDMRKLIDNERSAFFHIHKMIGAYVIFGNTDDIELFDSQDINEIHDFIEMIKVGEEKTGIIEQINLISNKPKFAHYSFAEYFATEFLCDKFESFHCRTTIWKYLIELFLMSQTGPHSFFHAKFEYNLLMFNEVYNEDLNEMFKSLLLEHRKLAWVIFKAIETNLEYFAMIILRFVKGVLCYKNLSDFINVLINSYNDGPCIVCIAVRNNAINVLTFITELIKDIDVKRLNDLLYCSDLPNSNPLVVSGGLRDNLRFNVELLDVLLSDLTPPALVNLFCQQITNKSKKLIHILIESLLQSEPGNEWFYKTLEKLNREQIMTIFSATDSEDMSPAHKAALQQSYTFFDKLVALLDKSQFKEICMAQDKSERTPIHYFKYTEQDCDKLKILLDKVYEDNMNEELTLNYFINQSNETTEQ